MKALNKELYLEGHPFYCWKIDDHTKVKHKVFSVYLETYIKILGKYHNTINYVDCFGGCGSYIDDSNEISFGSPVLASYIAKKFSAKKINVNIYVIDKDYENLKNIEQILQFYDIDVSIHYFHGDYDENSKNILRYCTNTPTFFFVDPFGYSLNYDLLKEMMKIPRSEMFLNFMYNGLNRGIPVDNVAATITKLFGTDEWKKIRKLSSKKREKACIDLFKDQLGKFSKYVQDYRIKFPSKNRTYYYLIFLSNHIKGARIMPYCFAEFNAGNLEYKGKGPIQTSLFDMIEYKTDRIAQHLFNKYKNKDVKYVNLLITSFELKILERDLKKTLIKLEKSNKIIIRREPLRKKNGTLRTSIGDSDTICFKEKNQ